MQLGGLTQTADAFGNVQGALSFFITLYRQLAEWGAIISRLDGFETAMANARAIGSPGNGIHVAANDQQHEIGIKDLLVKLPQGQPLVTAESLHIRSGQRVLIAGPSGAGKSTLFRAIAGNLAVRAGNDLDSGRREADDAAAASLFPDRVVAGRHRLPVGARRLSAGAPPGGPDAGGIAGTGSAPQGGSALESDALSRRATAPGPGRALLETPDYLFLDEATASLDEPSEAALYHLLQDKLPATTIISIGHRATLDAFHQRKVSLTKAAEQFTLSDDQEAADLAGR